jgi:hypothetical protein
MSASGRYSDPEIVDHLNAMGYLSKPKKFRNCGENQKDRWLDVTADMLDIERRTQHIGLRI